MTMILKRLWTRPQVRWSTFILVVLYLLTAGADFIAPYSEGDETTHLSFQPPSRVRIFRDGQLVRPYLYGLERTLNMTTFEQVWREDETQVYPVQFWVRRTVSAVSTDLRYVSFPLSLIPQPLRTKWGVTPSASPHLFGIDDPNDRTRIYLWGADGFGGDVFGNILFGARISLTLGLLAAFVAVPLGVLIGVLAAFLGGLGRSLVLGLADAVTAVPALFWVLLLVGAFPLTNASTTARYLFLVAAIAVTGWGTLARGTAAQLDALQREEFASAAQGLGNSRWRILRRHLLPNAVTYIVVSASVLVPTFILLESLVSFFGLGVQAPSRSWGLSVAELMGVTPEIVANRGGVTTGLFEITAYWWLWLPAVFLFLTSFVFVLLGEALRDVLDPKS